MTCLAPAAATIYLVRHGETIWNAEGRCQGQRDAELTETGEQQLLALASALGDVCFNAAYTSPLGRARRTADAILLGRGLRAAAVPELSEFSYGTLQGTRFDEWPEGLYDAWRENPWSVTFDGGESLAAARDRVLPAFARIASRHSGETVLISSHGHVNRLILLELSGRAPGDFWSVEQPNGGSVKLECSSAVFA